TPETTAKTTTSAEARPPPASQILRVREVVAAGVGFRTRPRPVARNWGNTPAARSFRYVARTRDTRLSLLPPLLPALGCDCIYPQPRLGRARGGREKLSRKSRLTIVVRRGILSP